MDLPTYTNIWRIEKRLYKLYDLRLPTPLPMSTFGIFLGALLVWCLLLAIVRMPFEFGNGWHLVIWVLPPLGVSWASTRPVIESKRLGELLASQITYLREAKVYVRLRPEYEPKRAHVQATVWHAPKTAPDRHQTRPTRPVRHLPTRTLPRAITPATAPELAPAPAAA